MSAVQEIPSNPMKADHQDHSSPPSHAHEEHESRPVAPQLSKRKMFGMLSIIAIVIALLFTTGFFPRLKRNAALAAEAEKVKSALPQVQVAAPKVSATFETVDVPGDVQPMEVTWLYPRTSGYLKSRSVDIGDHVEEGQLLAVIDAPEVVKELRQAEASLTLLRAKLDTAIAAQKIADVTDDRNRSAAPGTVSKQELDESSVNAESARTVVESAKAEIAVGEASVNRISQLEAFSRIYAPFAGTITARNVDVGKLVMSGNGEGYALFQLANTNPVRVFVNIPQAYASGVEIGMEGKVYVREFAGKEFIGKITRTAGAIDPTTRTLRTEIQVPNESGELLSGSYVQVKLEVRLPNPPLLVPASAMIFNADGQRIAVIDEHNRVHLKAILVDGDHGTQIGIAHGLEPTDRVVTNPGDRMIEGLEVAPSGS